MAISLKRGCHVVPFIPVTGCAIVQRFPNGLKACLARFLKMRGGPGETPIGDVYYGQKAANYLHDRTAHEWWEKEQAAMQRLVQHLPDGTSVLDVPFGTGRFVPLYLDKGMSVQGLEISQDMVRAAELQLGENAGHVKIDIGDARQMPYSDGSFDVASSFRFLQSIVSYGDAIRVIGELARVSRRYVILELGVRNPAARRRRKPDYERRMGGELYREEVDELLARHCLRVDRTEGPIGCVYPSADYYVFLCSKEESNQC